MNPRRRDRRHWILLIAVLPSLACPEETVEHGTDDAATVAVDGAAEDGPAADPVPDAPATRADAAPGGDGNGVTCGDETCELGEECCVSGTDPVGCMTAGGCSGPARLCDGPEDCEPGETCCLDFVEEGTSSSCRHPGEAPLCLVYLCNGDDDCDDGDHCCPFEGDDMACFATSC